eukprot:s374_g4.t7
MSRRSTEFDCRGPANALWSSAVLRIRPGPQPAIVGKLREASAQAAQPGSILKDVDGRSLHMQEMCRNNLVLVCTFKSVSCPVCPQKLQRLFMEPLRSLCREAMVKWIVLSPGPRAALKALREHLHLKDAPRASKTEGIQEDVPFVCDEDLQIAASVNATPNIGQILPCFFEIKADLSVGWSRIDRGSNSGDTKVQEFLTCRLNEAWELAEAAYCQLEIAIQRVRSSPEELQLGSQGHVPSPVIRDVFQFLEHWEGKHLAGSNRELHRTFSSFGMQKAEDCLEEAKFFRSRSLLEQSAELQEGRGRLLQRVLITGGTWQSCPGSIRQACQDGRYMVLVYSSMGLQNLEASYLEAVPWCSMSIPRLEEVRRSMLHHIDLLGQPIKRSSLLPADEPTPAIMRKSTLRRIGFVAIAKEFFQKRGQLVPQNAANSAREIATTSIKNKPLSAAIVVTCMEKVKELVAREIANTLRSLGTAAQVDLPLCTAPSSAALCTAHQPDPQGLANALRGLATALVPPSEEPSHRTLRDSSHGHRAMACAATVLCPCRPRRLSPSWLCMGLRELWRRGVTRVPLGQLGGSPLDAAARRAAWKEAVSLLASAVHARQQLLCSWKSVGKLLGACAAHWPRSLSLLTLADRSKLALDLRAFCAVAQAATVSRAWRWALEQLKEVKDCPHGPYCAECAHTVSEQVLGMCVCRGLVTGFRHDAPGSANKIASEAEPLAMQVWLQRSWSCGLREPLPFQSAVRVAAHGGRGRQGGRQEGRREGLGEGGRDEGGMRATLRGTRTPPWRRLCARCYPAQPQQAQARLPLEMADGDVAILRLAQSELTASLAGRIFLAFGLFEPDDAAVGLAAAAGAHGPWQLAFVILADARRRHLLNLASYGSVIGGLAQSSSWRHVLVILDEMRKNGLSPNVATYSAALKALQSAAQWRCALQLFRASRSEVIPDAILWTSAISAVQEGGDRWALASWILGEAHGCRLQVNMHMCSAAMSAMEKSSEWQHALLLFATVCSLQMRPDAVACNAALSTCGQGSRWELASHLLESFTAGRFGMNATAQAFAKAFSWRRCLLMADLTQRSGVREAAACAAQEVHLQLPVLPPAPSKWRALKAALRRRLGLAPFDQALPWASGFWEVLRLLFWRFTNRRGSAPKA